MRRKILARIAEIKEQENNFTKDNLKWRKAIANGTSIQMVEWDKLDDIELLNAFEMLIRRLYL